MTRLMRRVLEANSNSVDIGAHKGEFLRQLVNFAPKGRHFAFEPIPTLAERLREKFPSVEVSNCALGDATAEIIFHHVVNLPAWSGIKTQPYPTKPEIDVITVSMKRLDDVLPPKLPINFIKIDVEGAEYEVLRGAERIVTRYRPCVLFEHARIHALEYGTTPEMMFELIADRYGLEVFCLNGDGPLTEPEFSGICRLADESGYDRNAQTNFVALAAEGGNIT